MYAVFPSVAGIRMELFPSISWRRLAYRHLSVPTADYLTKSAPSRWTVYAAVISILSF